MHPTVSERALQPSSEGAAAPRVLDPKAHSFFRRSTIQTRLTVAFWMLGAMSLFGTLLAIWQIGQVQDQALANLRAARLAGELHAAASASTVQARVLAVSDDVAVAEMLAPALRANAERLRQLHEQLQQASPHPAAAALLVQAAGSETAFRQALRSALAARADASAPGAPPPALRDTADAFVQATGALMHFHGGDEQGASVLQEQASRARRLLLWVFFILTLVSVPFVVMLFIHILRPMYVAVRIARRVADGDLTAKVRTGGGDEMARLMLALDDMTMSLRRIVSQVLRGAGTVATTAGRVRQGHADLSQRTETQASTLQQTASSMEQLTATVAQNAGHARQASELAAGASQVAQQGGELVQQVVKSMGGLSASARRIEEVSGLIDGIAFQTNILALNAAVEAARAGDQGRGFAVVATEVRSLAQRCAEAAREIKGLIGASVQQVDAGGARVDQAGAAIAAIVTEVRQVAELIGQIDTISQEQSSGIQSISEAIGRIDGATQDNATLVSAAARTAAALKERAAAVMRVMSVFDASTGGQGTLAQARALVERGCEYLRVHGLQALMADVNRLEHGQFVHDDLYLNILDERGVFIAHGNNPGRLGTGPQLRDLDGMCFPQQFVRVAMQRGEGTVDYRMQHTLTGQPAVRSSFVKRVGSVVISCPYYKG